MMVNAGLLPGALVLAVLVPAALGAEVLVGFDVTVDFSFGFRAALTALLVIFIFSVLDFNRRRVRPPPLVAR